MRWSVMSWKLTARSSPSFMAEDRIQRSTPSMTRRTSNAIGSWRQGQAQALDHRRGGLADEDLAHASSGQDLALALMRSAAGLA